MSAETVNPKAAELPLPRLSPRQRRLWIKELYTTLPVARMIGLRDIKAKYKHAALSPLWLLIGR